VAIWNTYIPAFGIFYGIFYAKYIFGKLEVIWHIFPRFGTLYHEKSGNTGLSKKT
jgi:hypothetical protein